MGRLSVLLLGVANAFYLPGLAPVSYCREGQENPGDQPCTADIELFVNKLTSHDSAITFEYRYVYLTFRSANFYSVRSISAKIPKVKNPQQKTSVKSYSASEFDLPHTDSSSIVRSPARKSARKSTPEMMTT